MKKNIVLLLLIISGSIFGQSRDSLTYRLDEYFTALTGLKKFNGNVIISKNSTILLDKTYSINTEVKELEVTKDSRFIIASVSKVFIKYAVLKLAEQKRLNLSDNIEKFIPDFPNGKKITVEHLMHHQSGLPREITNAEKYDSLSLKKAIELAKLEKLLFDPGSQTFYSNVGFFVLHYIIDKASPRGYLAFMQKNVFDKMKLRNTAEFNSDKSISNFAYGFDNENGSIVPTPKAFINRFETGNYVTTIDDLYGFSQQIFDGRKLKKEFAIKLFAQDSVLSQAGGRPGYRAYLYRNLKTGITFVFTSNYTDMPVQETIADVMNILAGKPYLVPKEVKRIEIKLTDDILKRYVGKYSLEVDPTQVFTIELMPAGLIFKDDEGEVTAIHPDSETSFFEKPDSKDGYFFTFNAADNNYELLIISTGINLKTKRIE